MKIQRFFLLLLLAIPYPRLLAVDVYPGDDIQAKINSAQPGERVTFHDGDYYLSGSIYLNKPVEIWGNPNRVNVFGARNYGGSTSPYQEIKPVFFIRSNDVTIFGLTLNGQNRASAQGIYVDGVSNLLIQNTRVLDFKTSGIWLINVSNFQIKDTYVKDCAIGTSGYAGGSVNFANIQNGLFQRVVINEGEHAGGSLNGNGFKAMGVNGGYVRDILFEDCQVMVAPSGTWVGNGANPANICTEIASGLYAERVTFRKCYFNSNVSMVEDDGGRKNGFSVLFDQCIFDAPHTYNLELSMDDMIVRNCVVNPTTHFASNFDHQSKLEGIIIEGNRINFNIPGWSQAFFAMIRGGDDWIIRNNTFINNTGRQVYLLGPKDFADYSNIQVYRNVFLGPIGEVVNAGRSNVVFSDNRNSETEGYGAGSLPDSPIIIDPDPIDPLPAPTPLNPVDSIFIDAGSDIDTYFSGGNTATFSGDAPFNSERWGNPFSYNIPVYRDCTYVVELDFKELYWKGEGQRVFDVSIEGDTLVNDLDLVKDYPDGVGFSKIVKTQDSVLNIDFSASIDNAKVSALSVYVQKIVLPPAPIDTSSTPIIPDTKVDSVDFYVSIPEPYYEDSTICVTIPVKKYRYRTDTLRIYTTHKIDSTRLK